MMYVLDASGTTPAAEADLPLWPAGSAGTRLRIQNRSLTPVHVVVTKDNGSRLIIELPEFGDITDESWVDPTLAVCLRSRQAGADFTAVRLE